MKHNSFRLREWHVKHMEQTVVKFVRGLSENATRWEIRLNNKYGKISRVQKRIDYDMRHGVTNAEVSSFLRLISTEPSYLEVMASEGSMNRLNELQSYYTQSPTRLSFDFNSAVTRQ